MTREESLYPADWIRIAKKDLKRVERLLADNDVELVGFCLQQAVEKFLKSYLERTKELASRLRTKITKEQFYGPTCSRFLS